MRNQKLAVWACVGLLGLLVGCGEVFVSTSGAGGDGGAGAAPAGGSGAGGGQGGSTSEGGGPACVPQNTDACGACLFDHCEQRYCRCLNEEDCTGMLTCVAEMKPAEYCAQNNPDGIAVLGSLQDCGNEHCPDCAFTPVEDCEACQYEACAAEVNACYSLGACVGYLACVGKCKAEGKSDETCGNNCYGEGEGVPQAGKLINCAKNECGEPCKL